MMDVKAQKVTHSPGLGLCCWVPRGHTCLGLPKCRVLGRPLLDSAPEGNREPGLEGFDSGGRGCKRPQPLGTQLPP